MSLDLDAIERRLDAATPGPWHEGDGWVYTLPVYEDDDRLSDVLGMDFVDDDRAAAEHDRASRNAQFIAHARTDVADLLAEVRRLRAATVAAPVLGVATDGPAGDRAGYDLDALRDRLTDGGDVA